MEGKDHMKIKHISLGHRDTGFEPTQSVWKEMPEDREARQPWLSGSVRHGTCPGDKPEMAQQGRWGERGSQFVPDRGQKADQCLRVGGRQRFPTHP